MSIAWCSSKDEFVKKIGRATAMAKDYKLVLIREVPGLLSGAENTVYGEESVVGAEPSAYYWIYRYFL